MTGARDSVPAAFQAAAARFAETIGLTSKRLLYEFLAYPGPNGVTLSGTVLPADTEWRHITGARSSSPDADLVYITTKWMGFHIVKHYYVMRQYKEASGVVCSFLQFCKREGALPASLSKQLDVALEVRAAGCAGTGAAAARAADSCRRSKQQQSGLAPQHRPARRSPADVLHARARWLRTRCSSCRPFCAS